MLKFILKPIRVLFLFVITVVVVGIVLWRSGRDEEPEYVLSKKQDIVQEVSATGRVKPASSVNLAFDRSGRVSHVLAKTGDSVSSGQILMQLENSDLFAQLSEVEANVKAQSAKLNEIKRGTREEEVNVQEAKVTDAQKTLMARIQDAYTKSDDAVLNKVDQFINNPKTTAPVLRLNVTQDVKTDVQSSRVVIEDTLAGWKTTLAGLRVANDLSLYAISAKDNLDRVKSFLEKASAALNAATQSTDTTQATLDGYKSDVSAARSNIETAILNLNSAESNLLIQEKELALKQAPPLPEKILAQEAAHEEAQAKAENIRAQIYKTILRSPINGILTVVDAEIGEIVSANTVVASVISKDTLQTEVNIPEADVAKIKGGQKAGVTLDAYGSEEVFEAEIISIDLAETIIDGVATYKTVLHFVKKDERLKPGMTANVDIISARRIGVIVVPQRAIATKNGDKKISIIINTGAIEERSVVVGLRGSDGNIEIVEGVKDGEKVVVPR